MVILNAVISTINISLALMLLLLMKDEKTQAGRYGLGFLILLLVMNTILIWW